MSDAAIGYGTEYEIWDASIGTPAYVAIGEVTEVTPGAETADRVEVTHMGSTGRRREYIAGLIDSGEGSFVINWVPGNATDTLLRTLFESGDVVNHRVTFPNGVTCVYEASILGYEKGVPLDDRMTATVTVAVSGAQTWTSAAAPTNTVLPAISGTAQVGETLTALEGTWTGGPAYTYAWEADGSAIAGATSRTYTPVVGDVGAVLTVVVTGTNSAGSASAESVATAAVIAA